MLLRRWSPDNSCRCHWRATGTLLVAGTENADAIRVRPAKSAGDFRVVVNGEATVIARADVQRIKIEALGGDDDVTVFEVGSRISIPVSIDGGAGDDTLAGGSGNDNLTGASGNDRIYGGAGNDLVDGGEGNDSLVGGDGADSLYGGDGDDVLTTGQGDEDVADGGAGNNLVSTGAQQQFPIATFTGTPTGYSPQQMRFAYTLGDLNDENYTNRGQGQAIAIVDSFHTPTARKDLIAFSRQYGLPVPTNNKYFQQIPATGKKIRGGG